MKKLLLFGGKHCDPCKQQRQMLDTHGVKYEYVDCQSIRAQAYGIMSIPALMTVDKNNKPVDMRVGRQDIHTVRRMLDA